MAIRQLLWVGLNLQAFLWKVFDGLADPKMFLKWNILPETYRLMKWRIVVVVILLIFFAVFSGYLGWIITIVSETESQSLSLSEPVKKSWQIWASQKHICLPLNLCGRRKTIYLIVLHQDLFSKCWRHSVLASMKGKVDIKLKCKPWNCVMDNTRPNSATITPLFFTRHSSCFQSFCLSPSLHLEIDNEEMISVHNLIHVAR